MHVLYFSNETGGQHLDAVPEEVPQYQHDEGMWERPQKVTNGVRWSSGGVRGVQYFK